MFASSASNTPFARTCSISVPDTSLRKSIDITAVGKSRRASLELRAIDTEAAYAQWTPVARAQRRGISLEIGRSVDVAEQRERLERNWNSEDLDSRDQTSCSSDYDSDIPSSPVVSPRQRLERRWSAQLGQLDGLADTRSSRLPVLRRTRNRARRRSPPKASRSSVQWNTESQDSLSGLIQEHRDRINLSSMIAELAEQRAKRALRINQDSLGKLDSLGRIGLLSKESEIELGRIVQLGLAAEEQLQRGKGCQDEATSAELLKLRVSNKEQAHHLLVQYNLRLIGKVARTTLNRHGMDIEDLIVEGTKGLARAIDGYDPTKGYRFSTYGYIWIRQSIARFISEHSRVVRLPVHVLEAITKIQKARRKLEESNKEAVTNKEIAQFLGLSEEKVELYMSAWSPPQSLDDPLKATGMRMDHEGDQTLADVLEDARPNVDDLLMQDASSQLMKKDVDSVLEGLPLRERNILRCRYGLHTEVVSLTELSQAYGLSKERVRQIGEVALAKLQQRQASNGQGLKDGQMQKLPILSPEKYAALL